MCTRGSPFPPHHGCFPPAQELFILYDFRGWMVSFCTVSISSASSSWSNTWHRSMTNDSWIFCHRCARKIWMSEIFRVGICSSQRGEENRTEHQCATQQNRTEHQCAASLLLRRPKRIGGLESERAQQTYLAMHEDACKVELHLEAHIYVGTIDRGAPPLQGKQCSKKNAVMQQGQAILTAVWWRSQRQGNSAMGAGQNVDRLCQHTHAYAVLTRVNLRLGIWLRPLRCALVSFLYCCRQTNTP